MKKHFFIIAFFSLISFFSLSQNISDTLIYKKQLFLKGYVIYENGDSIWGHFQYFWSEDELYNTTNAYVFFKNPYKKKPSKLSKGKVKYYKKANDYYYKKRFKFYAYGGKKTGYLKLINKGKVKLYYMEYIGVTPIDASSNSHKGKYPKMYFIEKDGELIKVNKKIKKFRNKMMEVFF